MGCTSTIRRSQKGNDQPELDTYYHDANDNAPGLQLQPGPAADTTLLTGDAGGRVACGVVEETEGFPPGVILPPSAFAELRNPEGDVIGDIGFVPAGGGRVK